MSPSSDGQRPMQGNLMRVLIADDHELFGELLKLALEQGGSEKDQGASRQLEVTSVKSFEAACEAVGHTHAARGQAGFDLVLLDMRMPGMNGLTGLRRMRALMRDKPVAIISGTLTPAEGRTVMQEGAAGFIPKTMPLADVVAAIRTMLSGQRFVPIDYLMVGARDSAIAPRRGISGTLGELSPRERDILQEVVQGWTNKQIGQNLGIGEVTVKTHMMNLFRKIGAKNRADAVRIGLELLRDGEDDTRLS